VTALRDFWLKRRSEEGADAASDPVVLRTHLRLSRNLRDLPFPERLSPEERREFSQRWTARLRKLPAFRRSLVLDLKSLGEDERWSLREWDYISALEATRYEGSYLLLKEEGNAGVWLGGQQHLSWSACQKGLCPERLWKSVSRWASAVPETDYAFSPQHGYLSPDSREWGSGLVASVTLHLPAIVENALHEQTMAELSPLGLKSCPEYGFVALELLPVVRIFHDAPSCSPDEALRALREAVVHIRNREITERNRLWQKQGLRIWDRVNRAWGTLFSCQLLGAAEAFHCLSHLRAAAAGGCLPKDWLPRIDRWARQLLGGTFRVCLGENELPREREEAERARYVKSFITPEARPTRPKNP
jgi:protein arginine kinase